MKNIGRIFWKKFRRMDQQAKKKDQTERVIGLDRRTRQETVKWNQMTALRFQTGGRHQTSPDSLGGAGIKEMLIQHTLAHSHRPKHTIIRNFKHSQKHKITSQSCNLRDRAGSKEKKKSELWILGVGSAPTRVSVQWRMTNENHPHNGSMDCPAALYVAWKRGLPRKFACFLLFHLFFLPAGPFSWTFSRKFFQYFSLRDRLFLYGSCLAARRSKLVGGMCSMLRYGTGICCCAFI